MNSKWRNSITNSEAYSSFKSVGSDHRIVTANIKLSLRTTKRSSAKVRHDWKQLRYSPELCEQFNISLRNKFDCLYQEDSSPTDKYAALIQANEFAASQVLPTLPKRSSNRDSNNPSIMAARKRIAEMTKRYNICKSSIARKHLKEAKQALQIEYAKVDEERVNLQIAQTEAEFEANHTAQAWKVVNTFTGRKETSAGKLKGKSPEKRLGSWLNHFRDLLGSSIDPNTPDLEIDPVLTDPGINDT